MFSTSALKESWAYAYYWQCLLVRIGRSILWSSISIKIIAKALDNNDIIKQIMGMSAQWVQNLLINNQIQPPIENFKSIVHWIFPYFEVSAPPLGQNLGSAPAYKWTTKASSLKVTYCTCIVETTLTLLEQRGGCVKESFGGAIWVCYERGHDKKLIVDRCH